MSLSAGVIPGDCRAVLRKHVADASVRVCVTSPPYFGLRDYGSAEQIGLERSVDDYCSALVAVFREVRRCLTDDGTLWLNLGDSYAGSGRGWDSGRSGLQGSTESQDQAKVARERQGTCAAGGVKHGDLQGVPWRVALALRADGWYLRQDIIWHKPNPMPESVTNRCTKAHEYIFLLAKSRRYFFNAAAMQEPATGRPPGNTRPTKAARTGDAHHATTTGLHKIGARETRNKRSVWTVSVKPFKEAHFATFPPDLIEPCVLAGSAPGDLVLDPFGGAGTTAVVAKRHGRRFFICDTNPDYLAIAHRRLSDVP